MASTIIKIDGIETVSLRLFLFPRTGATGTPDATGYAPVSYTHLTLPTERIVQLPLLLQPTTQTTHSTFKLLVLPQRHGVGSP